MWQCLVRMSACGVVDACTHKFCRRLQLVDVRFASRKRTPPAPSSCRRSATSRQSEAQKCRYSITPSATQRVVCRLQAAGLNNITQYEQRQLRLGAKETTIMRSSIGLAILTYFVATAAAHAQATGSPQQGLRIALAQCAECHRVANERGSSSNPAAPSFKQISEVPGMTNVALRAALRTSHRTMPNVIIDDNEINDLTAYILSLREPNSHR
jgi:mono/diheme cytochrome c family protein